MNVQMDGVPGVMNNALYRYFPEIALREVMIQNVPTDSHNRSGVIAGASMRQSQEFAIDALLLAVMIATKHRASRTDRVLIVQHLHEGCAGQSDRFPGRG
nr:hypothetical protein [Pseudoxanthomonas suwonensis]